MHLGYDLSLPPSKCRQHLSIVPSASTLYKWRKQIAKADGDSGDFGAVTSQNTDLSGRNIIRSWTLQVTVLVLKSIQFSTIEIHFKTFKLQVYKIHIASRGLSLATFVMSVMFWFRTVSMSMYIHVRKTFLWRIIGRA